MKKIAVINDISGFGRCSLTAALPVISACGVEACPAPTAVLSAQTGFKNYHMTDLTYELKKYLNSWSNDSIEFDSVITGFLSSTLQADIVLDFIKKQKKLGAIIFCDPVMADDGCVYPTFDKALCDKICTLAYSADIITPNLTEFSILLNTDYDNVVKMTDNEIYEYSKALLKNKTSTVLITGIKRGSHLKNLICQKDSFLAVNTNSFGGSFSGTGDLFVSAVAGLTTKGIGLSDAVKTTSKFIENAAKSALLEKNDKQTGTNFQYFLRMLNNEK